MDKFALTPKERGILAGLAGRDFCNPYDSWIESYLYSEYDAGLSVGEDLLHLLNAKEISVTIDHHGD